MGKYTGSPTAKAGNNARYKRWLMKHPEQRRDIVLRGLYGMTLVEYWQMFANQEGLCAVCSAPMCLCPVKPKCPTRACVDHDHDTGKVRGLLCHGCNVAIGYIKESPTSLRNAAGYLESVA